MAKAKREQKREAARNNPQVIVRKRRKQILSNENWSPTIDGKLDVYVNQRRNGDTSVQVWGGDDHGVCMYGDDWDAAVREFDRIVNLTTEAELRDRGFEQA